MYTGYQVGDKIHILPYEEMGYPDHVNSAGKMEPWYDTEATISQVRDDSVRILEDRGHWSWHFDNIEPTGPRAYISDECLLDFL